MLKISLIIAIRNMLINFRGVKISDRNFKKKVLCCRLTNFVTRRCEMKEYGTVCKNCHDIAKFLTSLSLESKQSSQRGGNLRGNEGLPYVDNSH